MWFSIRLCPGDTMTISLIDHIPGGVWYSTDTNVATIDSITGFVRIISGPVTDFVHKVGTSIVSTIEMATLELPAPVSGPTTVCVGSSILLNCGRNDYWNEENSWETINTTVALSGTTTTETNVTGVTVGSAVITYYDSYFGCSITDTLTIVPASCTGSPTAGTASVGISGICPGFRDTLKLTGHTSCGTTLQWQYSTDNVNWFDLFGAICATAKCTPLVATYYRCKVTCISSGLSSYSNHVLVAVRNSITAHAVLAATGTACDTTHFCLHSCISSALNVTTYYGDGTHDNHTPLLPSWLCDLNIAHNYSTPGTYTVKHLLFQDTTLQDSVVYSYDYLRCSFLPIKIYYDANNNCINDSGDIANHVPVTIRVDSNGTFVDSFTATSGLYYQTFAPPGTIYQFSIITLPPGAVVSCLVSGTALDTVLPYGTAYNIKFLGLNCGGTDFDFGIRSLVICGRHQSPGTITLVNFLRCSSEYPSITAHFSPKYVFHSAHPTPTTVTGNTVTWNIFDTTNSVSFFLVRSPGSALLLPGDTVHTDMYVTPFSGDVDTSNNRIIRVDTVTSSYDPNEMSVTPPGFILPCTELEYTVHFENTGNDTAHNIHIMDTLSDNVDIKTLRIVAASAEMNIAFTRYNGHNIVKFDLPNIMLPDSSHHDQCMGMIVFKVKTKNGLAEGTTIMNRAGIYFDDNDVVMTNSVENTIGVAPITGPYQLCKGDIATFTSATPGGIWAMQNSTATISGGEVTTVEPGSNTVSYTVSNSCTSITSTKAINIASPVTPLVSIVTNGGPDTLCPDTWVTFKAAATSAGTSPQYHWQVNGIDKGNDSVYSYAPSNNDMVILILTSNAYCAVHTGASTNKIMTVSDVPASPAAFIKASPGFDMETGKTDTLTAIVENGGAAPVYQWMVNSSPVPGATTNTYVTSVTDNTTVSCQVENHWDCGILSALATANITVHQPEVFPAIPTMVPNPNHGYFTIKWLLGTNVTEDISCSIRDMVGREYYKGVFQAKDGVIDQHIIVNKGLPKGLYLLNIRSQSKASVLNFLVE